MSEKEKMQTEELAKIMDDAKRLVSRLFPLWQGLCRATRKPRAQTRRRNRRKRRMPYELADTGGLKE